MPTPITFTSRTPTIPILDPDHQRSGLCRRAVPLNTKGIEAESNIMSVGGSRCTSTDRWARRNIKKAAAFPNGGLWVANTPKNIETIGLFWQHKNWDVGILDKRVGTMYNDNGSLTDHRRRSHSVRGSSHHHQPFSRDELNVNYTQEQSWLRGSKIGVAINNLADSHNIVGITPFTAATAAVAFAPNPWRSVESAARAQRHGYAHGGLRSSSLVGGPLQQRPSPSRGI